MLATLLLLQATVQQPLNLTCFGSGVANKPVIGTARTNTNIYGSIGTTPVSGYGNSTTTVTGMRQQGFGDQVDVRLFSGDDRIRLPRTMLPPIHGGNAGWFKLKNVVVEERSIKAKAAINFASSPNVHIDRVTGTISISGKAGDFSGQCEAVDANAATKF